MHICPRVARSVYCCIGIMLKPVAHSEPFVERDTKARGQGKLEESAEVLRSKVVPAKQSAASPHI